MGLRDLQGMKKSECILLGNIQLLTRSSPEEPEAQHMPAVAGESAQKYTVRYHDARSGVWYSSQSPKHTC